MEEQPQDPVEVTLRHTDEQVAIDYWREMNPGEPLHASCLPGITSMVAAIRKRHPELQTSEEFLCWANEWADDDLGDEDCPEYRKPKN